MIWGVRVGVLLLVVVMSVVLVPSKPIGAGQVALELLERFNTHEQIELGTVPVRIANGRDYVDAYRSAHIFMGSGGRYKGLSEDHLPLLQALVSELEREGYISTALLFEDRKTEILQKFWLSSSNWDVKELGYKDWADYTATLGLMSSVARGLEADKLRGKWQ